MTKRQKQVIKQACAYAFLYGGRISAIRLFRELLPVPDYLRPGLREAKETIETWFPNVEVARKTVKTPLYLGEITGTPPKYW